MKKFFLLGAALFAVSVLSQAQEPARFGIKSGYVKTVSEQNGQVSTTQLWFDDYGAVERTVVTMPMGEFGEYRADILAKDGISYLIDEENKKVTVMEGRPEINFLDLTPELMKVYKMKELGTEPMLGYECTKYYYEMRQLLRNNKITVWVWEGIPIKTVMVRSGGDNVSEVVELIQDPDFPENIFMKPEY